MTFLEFYSQHFGVITLLLSLFIIALFTLIVWAIVKLSKNTNVKTPWFEIAPDTVDEPESEDMAKTRLLIKRQLEYVNNFLDGLYPILLTVEKAIVEDALNSLTVEEREEHLLKNHIETCVIQGSTNELVLKLKSYINGLLVINHIGHNKTKIANYSRGHVNQILGITKKSLSKTYTDIAKQVCLDTSKYWEVAGISDISEWVYSNLVDLLVGLSELRYSDFNKDDEEYNEENCEKSGKFTKKRWKK